MFPSISGAREYIGMIQMTAVTMIFVQAMMMFFVAIPHFGTQQIETTHLVSSSAQVGIPGNAYLPRMFATTIRDGITTETWKKKIAETSQMKFATIWKNVQNLDIPFAAMDYNAFILICCAMATTTAKMDPMKMSQDVIQSIAIRVQVHLIHVHISTPISQYVHRFVIIMKSVLMEWMKKLVEIIYRTL